MKHRKIAGILLIATLLSLSACSLPFQLPEGDSALTCRITDKQEKLLTVEVLESNLHFDEGTILLVQYHAITGGTSLDTGDVIRFTYAYLYDVTVQDDLPYMTVDTVSPISWPAPSDTQAADADRSQTD